MMIDVCISHRREINYVCQTRELQVTKYPPKSHPGRSSEPVCPRPPALPRALLQLRLPLIVLQTPRERA